MGVFDLIKKDDRQETKRSAIEQAQNPEDPGLVGGAAVSLVTRLLDSGIDGRGPLGSAEEVAADALAKAGTPEKAVRRVVSNHVKLAAAQGFVTSLGGFITLPVSLPANVAGFYMVATRMTAAVAHLRGYDIRDPQIRSAVLLTLVGAESDDLLRKAGTVAPPSAMANLAAQGLPGPALMMVNKAVGFKIMTQVGKTSLSGFGRAVPVIGGAIGAGVDGMLMKSVGKQALEEFPARS
ncbi:MAG: EcsC family protein [Dermatophilaceae bacterium]